MGLQFTKRELDKYKRLARSDKFKADIKKQNLNIIKEKSNQFNKIEAKDLQTKELEKVILDNGIKKMPNTKFKKIRRGIYTNPNTNEIKDIISKPKDCIIRE